MLLDGTWNDSAFGPSDTNIVRLRRIISDYCNAADTPSPFHVNPLLAPSDMVTKPVSDSRSNIVFYERGVGTGTWLNRLVGGALGTGMDWNIRRAYKFLSFHYLPGDQIFIFGFSRGSYTARSLVGYIASAGLLRRDRCDEETERVAWDYYRTRPNDRLPGVWAGLKRHMHDRDLLRIDCVGVFDTVGALGIPLGIFGRANREQYEFHDVELSSITRVNLQAIAIDEQRWPFQATIWRKPPFKKINTVTEQVWFSGAHADVGGGNVKEAGREKKPYLDDVTLDWMLRRLKFHFKDFPVAAFPIANTAAADPDPLHYDGWVSVLPTNSRAGVYRLYKTSLRSIANLKIDRTKLGFYQTTVGYDRHATPINEMIHISALQKIGKTIKKKRRYLPKNLAAIIPRLAATYATPAADVGSPIYVVNWDGAILDPQVEGDKSLVNALLARANQELLSRD
jgi:hypothetical protein